MDIWGKLLKRIKDSESELLQNHDALQTRSLLTEFSKRHDALEGRLAADTRANVSGLDAIRDLLQKSLDANRIIQSKLDGALHELRVLNFRLNSFAEPRSPEALFRALQEESLRESLKIIKLEMPSAMHVLDHRSFLRYAISNAGEGVVIEFGVFSGMTINWMAEDFPERTFLDSILLKACPSPGPDTNYSISTAKVPRPRYVRTSSWSRGYSLRHCLDLSPNGRLRSQRFT